MLCTVIVLRCCRLSLYPVRKNWDICRTFEIWKQERSGLFFFLPFPFPFFAGQAGAVNLLSRAQEQGCIKNMIDFFSTWDKELMILSFELKSGLTKGWIQNRSKKRSHWNSTSSGISGASTVLSCKKWWSHQECRGQFFFCLVSYVVAKYKTCSCSN